MLNNVSVMGRMTADPEIRHTQNNVAVTTFRLAVDRDFKDKNTGERGADFLPVVCWRGLAEYISRYGAKGRMVGVTGRIQVRDFNDSSGAKKIVTEILADNVYFTDTPKKKDPFYPVNDEEDADIPF